MGGKILVNGEDLAVEEDGVGGLGCGRATRQQYRADDQRRGKSQNDFHPSIFLNSAFATFSSVERGISSTKRISLGTLKSASALRQAAITLSCRSGGARATPACGMMNTTGTSSSIGCLFPTTAASRTPATTAITCSISDAATFSPPTFSMSLARSPNFTKPFCSRVTRSPVRKKPCSSKLSQVAFSLCRYSLNNDSPGTPLIDRLPVPPTCVGVPSSSVMRISYSAAARPIDIGMLGWSISPTMPWVMVSVMPHQPMILMPNAAKAGGWQIAVPQSRNVCCFGISCSSSAFMQNGMVEVQLQPCSAATFQNRRAENRGWITQDAPTHRLPSIE